MYLQWLLVANASHARIFALNSLTEKKMHLVAELQHLGSRKKISELVTDKLGQNSLGSFVESSNPHVLEMEHFAKDIAHKLNSACQKLPIAHLTLVMPGHFYGLLCKHLNAKVKAKIQAIAQKDYTLLSAKELKTLFFPTPIKIKINSI